MSEKPSEVMDAELIMDCKLGKRGAYNTLMDRWYQRVYNYALRYTGDHHSAEHIAQTTFIQVYRKIDHLKDTRKFKSWIYSIATNFCHSESRKKSAKSKLVTTTLELPQVADFNHPEKIYNQEERGTVLRQILGQISPEQRQVIIMKEYEGLKFREIADALKISENTVKARLYYGLDAMKKIVNKNQWLKEMYYE